VSLLVDHLDLEVDNGTTNLLLQRCPLLLGAVKLITKNSQLTNGVVLAKIRQQLRDGVVLLTTVMLI
jgi:hypothetical protein